MISSIRLTLIFFLAFALNAISQVSINTTGNPPDGSSMLDITSTTKGLLIPRMTTANRTSIASPANGLIVYDTDMKTLYYYDTPAALWRSVYSSVTPAAVDWSVSGNAGIIDGTNYIGTNGAVDLDFRTDNIERMTIKSTGEVGIGLTMPASLFHTAGEIRTGIPSGGLGGAGATTGSLLWYNSTNTNTVNLQSGVTTSSYTLTLPTAQGAAKSFLQNDGSGNLSWAVPKVEKSMINQSTISGIPKNTTVYSNSTTWGYTVENYCQTPMPACIVTNMKVNIYSPNAVTSNTVFTLMKNGVATALVITVGSAATGWFSATGSVAYAEGDLIDVKIATGSSGSGNIVPLSITIFYQPQ